MIFLQTADTTSYMILGYAVIFGALFLHLASFFVRNRNLHRDLEMLEKLNKKSSGRSGKRKKRK